jgi:lysozyme
MKVSDIFLEKLMEMEGCRLVAYRDAAGVPTIGYGHTAGVRMGDRISQQQAKALLRQDAEAVMRQVRALDVARTEAQLEALTSFAFNLGIARLRSSTLLKVIRQGGSKQAIQREFKRWVYAGGRKLSGLVKRREWEASHFFAPSYPTDEEIINRV